MLDNKSKLTAEQAIEVLENRTGYRIICEDCDADVVSEAIQMAVDALKK